SVPCRQVVGVAHDMRQRSLVPTGNEDHLMQYFVPFSQVPVPPFVPNPDRGAWGLLLRVDADAAAVAPAIRRAIVGSRADVPFVRVRPYAQLLDRQMRPWRLGTALLALFSGLALLVGARPGGVTAMILREAMALAAVGIGAGWLAAVIGARWLQSLLFDTSRTD